MNENNQYCQRYWDKKAYRYEKRVLNRNSLYYEPGLEHVAEMVQKGSKVIDLGCGSGVFGSILMDKVSSYVGVDISASMISLAKGKKIRDKTNTLEFGKGDMHSTWFNNQEADITLLCNVLEYTSTPDILLLEAKRITRPNGLVITSTSCYGSVSTVKDIFHSLHILITRTFKLIPPTRFYTYSNLRHKLESSGMVIIAEKKLKHMGKTRLFAVLKT